MLHRSERETKTNEGKRKAHHQLPFAKNQHRKKTKGEREERKKGEEEGKGGTNALVEQSRSKKEGESQN